MPDAPTLLARLRDPSDSAPAARLAALVVDDVLARPIAELIDAAHLARALQESLRALTASDAAEKNVTDAIVDRAKELAAETKPLDALVPSALKTGARDLLELPFTPPRDVVLTILDRDPVKRLLRAQVIDTLVAFGRRAASPVADSPIARGLGGLSKLAGQMASRPSALGSIASAVSSEVERQVEKRATDFADTAVAGILSGIADQASDPARAQDQAALRLAILDGVLALKPSELAAIARDHAGARVAVARKALAAWSQEPTFLADVEHAVTRLLAREAQRPLGDVLADLGLREVAAAHAREALRPRVAGVVASDAFAAWLGDLLAGA